MKKGAVFSDERRKFRREGQLSDYVVNGKSAIEWIMERYQVTIHKESHIKNDPNDWAKEHDKPRYILDLLLSVIMVSLETVRVVKGLPGVCPREAGD